MVRILLFFGGRNRRGLCVIFLLVSASNVFGSEKDCDTSGRKVQCYVRDSTGYVLEIHNYKDGMKWGSWEKYNYDGELVEKNYYKKGERVWTFFYRDEELIKSINKKGKIKTFKGCGCT